MKNYLELIGVVGHASSGKDTIANYLVENYGYTKLPFVQHLKEVVDEIFSLKSDINKTRLAEKWGIVGKSAVPGFIKKYALDLVVD